MAELFFGVWTPKTDALGLTENNASIALDRAIFVHASSQGCMAGLDPNTFFLHVPIYVRRSYERLARSSALSLLITSEDLVQRSGTFRSASLLTRVCTPRVDYWGTNAEDDNETLGIHGFKWQAVSGEKLVGHATTISECWMIPMTSQSLIAGQGNKNQPRITHLAFEGMRAIQSSPSITSHLPDARLRDHCTCQIKLLY
ncbi:hypothetical protein PTI98_006427 [Pleurotus ostreatus]|nr:hypothetical protein PTI98_006427 [Pleurotus ostreatus]